MVLGGHEIGREQCGCLNRSMQVGAGRGGAGAGSRGKAGRRVASMDPEDPCVSLGVHCMRGAFPRHRNGNPYVNSGRDGAAEDMS